VRRVIRRTKDGAFALDLDYFEYHTTVARSFSRSSSSCSGRRGGRSNPSTWRPEDGQRFADVAASVQLVLEES
jgi:carbamoyltransferase